MKLIPICRSEISLFLLVELVQLQSEHILSETEKTIDQDLAV